MLLPLDETPIRTRAAPAEAIRADGTRVIAVLEDLERRDLIRRQPDPEDRAPADRDGFLRGLRMLSALSEQGTGDPASG